MTSNVGLLSYLSASLAYLTLAVLLMFLWRERPYRKSLITASLLTALWAAVVAAGTLAEYPPVILMEVTEILRNAGWIYFLLQLTATRFDGVIWSINGHRWRSLFAVVLGLLLIFQFGIPELLRYLSIEANSYQEVILTSWVAMAVVGLLLLEQVFRNASDSERWSLKYLCFGLGVLFAYDLLMYSEALLFKQLDPQYWQARGFANALVTPLLAISMARGSSWTMALNISRQVVFHTVSLLGAGVYLIMMALAGYFIKYMGGSWGGVLQISFLIATGALLLALLFSGKIRARTRVFLSKHFFNYKYDYREEWLKFTGALSTIEDDVPEGIIRTMSPLVNSPAGLLWGSHDGEAYTLLSHWEMPAPVGNLDLDKLAHWMRKSTWVIDVDELARDPALYDNLSLPSGVAEIGVAWLIIPLMFGDKLQGILLLKHSELQRSINWEDRDLLKTAGRQAASHLAQYLASQALLEARQFDAFNRLSAYVIHDLKNILAQQSLMVANAEKHKHKPEFVDDMISTVSNSVNRMTKLMEQMRSGTRETTPSLICLQSILEKVVAARSRIEPKPALFVQPGSYTVHTDAERMATVFSHLIQNAQEACDNRGGTVEVRLQKESTNAVIEIIDNGKGMSPEFIQSRLFKPFDSTKGLTGMGIGAFESREFIRSLGGDIQVKSTLGSGSTFRAQIPCSQEEQAEATPYEKIEDS